MIQSEAPHPAFRHAQTHEAEVAGGQKPPLPSLPARRSDPHRGQIAPLELSVSSRGTRNVMSDSGSDNFGWRAWRAASLF